MMHQIDLISRDNRRIETEVENTDYYLNKVQPISSFTTMVTLLRSITEEEEHLNRISEIQNQFFKSMQKDKNLLPDLSLVLAEQRVDLDKVSPYFAGITSAIDELAELKKQDLLYQCPKILMGDELEKFDSLFQKIQNHRELAKQCLDDDEQLPVYETKSHEDTDGKKSAPMNQDSSAFPINGISSQPITTDRITLNKPSEEVLNKLSSINQASKRSQSDLKRPNLNVVEDSRSQALSSACQTIADFGGAIDRGHTNMITLEPLALHLLRIQDAKSD